MKYKAAEIQTTVNIRLENVVKLVTYRQNMRNSL